MTKNGLRFVGYYDISEKDGLYVEMRIGINHKIPVMRFNDVLQKVVDQFVNEIDNFRNIAIDEMPTRIIKALSVWNHDNADMCADVSHVCAVLYGKRTGVREIDIFDIYEDV